MKNMKVSSRLIIGFGLLTILLLAIAAGAFYGLGQLNSQLDSIARVNNTEARFANQLRASIQDRAIAVRNLALVTDPQDMAREADRITQQERIYADAYQQLSRMFTDEAGTTEREKTLLAALKQDEAAAIPPFRKSVQLALNNDAAAAARELLQNARPAQRIWLARAVELANFEDQLNEQAQREAVATYSNVRALIAVIAGSALLVAVGTTILIARSILRQLGGEPSMAQYAAAQIADGNLMIDLPVTRGDSSSLMASLETMRAKLASIVQGIKTSAESISIAAGEVAQGNVDLSQRTEEQAASLEETAASMEELTSTVKQNTDNARQGSTLAAAASQTASSGGEVVRQVVGTMADITSSSQKVSEIISVIEGIAFQTNILALNAAVEAARAGEQGRGFAVVAGEVRTLAQRSAVAAKEIKALIETSVSHVAAGSQLVSSAGATMDEIVRSVRRVTDIMGEIASASAEQGTGIEQVNVAVTQMDEVTQQNAALVEQATAAAQSMADQAESLRAAVSIFKVESRSQAAAAATPVRATADRAAQRREATRPAREPVKAEGADWATF
ncbi:methyl-accepting chemotaxis protein [Burkholderia gladioli]|uniref:methyl-accepting chemotaxis protein n=1 Tax=Burkholderia gladioli TaxID=28095 RepID=UPI0016414FCC|nr:methyl-accepting chemotaxis protein [Burkholderia gladioli]MBJ9710564.1 MCP four helix bundle domain-containing protein [Burkholderia gladioli]MBU9158516.1 MCP four helix bundle domain-containing protein [Burkholderia gladioli]MCH7269745.1 methyl-accepting chemotaxis protein [Burkholderia gladioli]MDN7922011.1 methyl-accepting chemotaxis protein [Burkholderia gladioli]MDR8091808.1 MCP four helix bundle domain-containing protein [Burkholderia gladioli]